MKRTLSTIMLTILTFCSFLCRSEQRDSVGRFSFDLGFDVRPSYAFSSFLDDVLQKSLDKKDASNIHESTSFHLQYGFSYPNNSRCGRLYPGVRQGVGIATTLFSHPHATGLPLSFYLFQGSPIHRFSDRLSLDYEWNFGLSAGWHPSDGFTTRSNLIVGSRVNAYINLGIGINWAFSEKYSLIAGLEVTHFSNGNTSFPNPGVNLAGARIGIRRLFGKRSQLTPFRSTETDSVRGVSVDLTGYGAWRRRVYRGGDEPLLLDGHFPVAGLSVSPMWNARRWLRVGGSVDMQWDKSTDLKRHYISGATAEDIRFGAIPFFSQVCVGVAARCELVMPIFSVNVGVGYNFIGPVETKASYQMANLKIYITRRLFLNIGYQLLNFQRQNNLMLGMGYTFRSPRGEGTSLYRTLHLETW